MPPNGPLCSASRRRKRRRGRGRIVAPTNARTIHSRLLRTCRNQRLVTRRHRLLVRPPSLGRPLLESSCLSVNRTAAMPNLSRSLGRRVQGVAVAAEAAAAAATGRSDPRLRQPLCIGILSSEGPKTLQHTLESYRQNVRDLPEPPRYESVLVRLSRDHSSPSPPPWPLTPDHYIPTTPSWQLPPSASPLFCCVHPSLSTAGTHRWSPAVAAPNSRQGLLDLAAERILFLQQTGQPGQAKGRLAKFGCYRKQLARKSVVPLQLRTLGLSASGVHARSVATTSTPSLLPLSYHLI